MKAPKNIGLWIAALVVVGAFVDYRFARLLGMTAFWAIPAYIVYRFVKARKERKATL